MLHRAPGAAIQPPFVTLIASLALLTATSTFLPTGAFATTAAGRTKGMFSVSPTGAATYTIPIWSPPGPHGMQPSIALTYNSQGGNGYVGVGWSVSGLSSIYRCNLTYAQDAAPGPVALATSDGYCMDGQRLRLTGGTYGEVGSTYQTEVANFVTVTAYPYSGINGIGYWEATDRNGRTYVYGDVGNSAVLATNTDTAVSWMLSEVTDPYGNVMTVTYNQATGSAVPSVISWTPTSHGASTYSYTMTFAYGTNVPQSSVYGYIAGSPIQNTNLLSSISIAYSSTAVRTYYLTYTQQSQTTGTGRDVLTQVQECAGTGTSNCLSPTVITYQSGTAGLSMSATSLPGGSYAEYDFNGDGYPDILYASAGTYYVAFGSASGFGTPVSTGISTSASQILPGDMLGKGQDGLLVATGGTWYYYTYNGSNFSSASTGLTYDATAVQYLIADINGDGLPDLVAAYYVNEGANGYTYTINVRINTGAGGSVTFGSAVQAFQILDSLALAAQPKLVSNTDNAGGQILSMGGLRRFDFNGDGRDDLALQTITKTPIGCTTTCTYKVNVSEMISAGTTSSPSFTGPQIYSATGSTEVPVAFLNFNSDACTDYIVGGTLYIAPCNGSTPSTIGVGSATVIGAMDWNGDGRTDILVANGSTIGVYLSTGNGISSLVSTSIPYSSSNLYFTFQPGGYGQDALGYSTTSGAAYYYPHNGLGTPPDLLTSVTDAFGNSAKPTYVPITQNNYTAYTDATYPYQNWIGPMYVVNEAVFSDPSSGSGGAYNQTFWYWAAWNNLQGRGWQSFYATEFTDSRNSLQYLHYYQRSFPYTGMDNEDRIYNGSFDLSQTDRTLASLVTLSSTQYQERYFAYFSNVTTEQSEVNGTENGDLITTTSTTYALDDYGTPTSIIKTVTDNDPNSPYSGTSWTTTTTNTPDESTNPYCLSLLSKSVVAYTGGPSGSTAVTVTNTLSDDTTHCDYTEIATQSNSGSSYAVTEALGYDAFGNINSDSITGAGMAARTTTASWTNSSVTTGQFPMSVTDPSGAQTQYNYNFSFGLKSSATDPNNLTTSWQYDPFGRKNQETRPDGTYTTWTYYNCASYIGCPLGSYGLNILHDVYNTDASVQSYGTDFLDAVDRPLVNLQIMMGGSTYSRVDTRYDSLGRVAERSFPCTYSSITTTCSYWTTNTYDVLNRLTQSQRPISSTNSNPQTTSYAYAGRSTTVTDALSNARTMVTDVNGWLRRSTDAYAYYVQLAYDAAGNKTSVIDDLGRSLWSSTYNYGIAAFPATVTDTDMGTWTFTYDALGEKTGWKDAKSQSFSETYDALSRPTSRSEPDYFTQWTWGSSASSHNVGKLQSVCTGTGTSPTNCTTTPGYSESETYDSYGRLSQRSRTLPGEYGGTFNYTWAYNATTGLLNTLTYPASYPSTYSLQLQYGYSEGILQTVTDVSDTPNVTVWNANTTNPRGQITEETLGNGIVTNRSYDAVTGWLGSAQSGVGGGSGVKNLAFLYDEMGDVTQRQDNNLGLTENIYYDNLYRLTQSKLNGTQNLAVTYGFAGNIATRSDIANGASWTYSSTQIHAVTEAGSSAYQYAYDANGNATSRQGSSITWASYNYPTSVSAGSGSTAETVTLSYGPDRQRWQQYYTGNSTTETTDYVGKQMEVVVSGGVTDFRHYISGGVGVVAVYSRKSNGTNTFSYLLSDHQASMASITNSSGAPVAGESFTAFGNRRNPTTWSGADSNTDLTTIAGITREGYTFQTALGLWMGMNHMNGRVQDAVTGRMLSADPHVPDKTNTQSYNRYSYLNNNPLSGVDPSGFIPSGLTKCVDVCVFNAPHGWGGAWGIGGGDWGAVGAGAGIGAYGPTFATTTSWFNPDGTPVAAQSEIAPGGNGINATDPNDTGTSGAVNAGTAENDDLEEVKVTSTPLPRAAPAPTDNGWDLLANLWPGYQLGTCISLSMNGSGCSAGKWTLAAFGALPIPLGKVIKAGELATEAAEAAAGDGYSMALGLWKDPNTGAQLLEPFANEVGSLTYGQIAGTWFPSQSAMFNAMTGADALNFNLGGMSEARFLNFVENPSVLEGNYTNWELNTIMNTPSLLGKTTFYGVMGP